MTRAATAFTTKNARFFAGYAVDAYRIPLAWTPPGRVFAQVGIDRLAVLDGHGVRRTWGRFGERIESAASFRASAGGDPLELVPADVRERLGDGGDAALGVDAGRVPVVVPCRWILDRGSVHAVVSEEVLALAGGGPDVAASLTIDHASQWRARAMAGVLVQGAARIHVARTLSSGRRSAEAIAGRAGIDPDAAAVLRIRPGRLVWWRGWDSGTVRPR